MSHAVIDMLLERQLAGPASRTQSETTKSCAIVVRTRTYACAARARLRARAILVFVFALGVHALRHAEIATGGVTSKYLQTYPIPICLPVSNTASQVDPIGSAKAPIDVDAFLLTDERTPKHMALVNFDTKKGQIQDIPYKRQSFDPYVLQLPWHIQKDLLITFMVQARKCEAATRIQVMAKIRNYRVKIATPKIKMVFLRMRFYRRVAERLALRVSCLLTQATLNYVGGPAYHMVYRPHCTTGGRYYTDVMVMNDGKTVYVHTWIFNVPSSSYKSYVHHYLPKNINVVYCNANEWHYISPRGPPHRYEAYLTPGWFEFKSQYLALASAIPGNWDTTTFYWRTRTMDGYSVTDFLAESRNICITQDDIDESPPIMDEVIPLIVDPDNEVFPGDDGSDYEE